MFISLYFSFIFNFILSYFDSGPVSEKPDEGLFFVDKETEEIVSPGMIEYLFHTYSI